VCFSSRIKRQLAYIVSLSVKRVLIALSELEYTIKRSSRRRSIGLEVRDAQVTVRAPRAVPERELLRLVRHKQHWIRDKVAHQKALLAAVPDYDFATGCRLTWLGGELEVMLAEGAKRAIWREGNRLQVRGSRRCRRPLLEQSRELVRRWYQSQALALLSDKSQDQAGRLGVTCRQVKVRATRSKWGHCTHCGVIQYNWHILLAPEPVVDYLVAHEVSHLRHPNHSPAFWALVERLSPDYRRQREWLKAQGHLLVL